MKVSTAKGLIERDQLHCEDVVEWHDNARVTVTYWFLGDVEVRKDVHVAVLRGVDSQILTGDTN